MTSKRTLVCKSSKYLALNAQSNASNVGYHTIQKYKNVDCVVICFLHSYAFPEDENRAAIVLEELLPDSVKVRAFPRDVTCIALGASAIIAGAVDVFVDFGDLVIVYATAHEGNPYDPFTDIG